jgi:restriction system protein
MITNAVPTTWQDLQRETARILRECEFSVEVEKRVATARGEVEVDVYAQETVDGRHYQLLCECKHWKVRVPKSAIHSFRTVVGDFGANVGYLISLSGFQSGAFAAAKLTNIKLLTWEEFQDAFEETWYERYFSPGLSERLDPLLTYTEPLLPGWFVLLPEEEQAAFLALKARHDALGFVIMALTPHVRVFSKLPRYRLPLIDHVEPSEDVRKRIPNELLHVTGYREFFDLAVRHGDQAIEEFRAIRDRNGLRNDSPYE